LKKSQQLETLFLHCKPARLLISIKGVNKKRYASNLAKEVDCTYSHCVRILKDLKKLGLVTIEKKGRIKLVGLTQLGEDVAFQLENLLRSLGRADEQ